MSLNYAAWKSTLLKGASIVVMTTGFSAAGQTAYAATAAQSGASAVPDVIVTAERRASSIQKTPVAITAVTSATIDKTFITEISGLNAQVPSLEITKTSGTENLVTIRGVGSETPENSQSTSPGVSEFIDGVYIANSLSFDQTLFDIDHIEVLRGPQGDLYGESSIGGAINIITKQPELNKFGGMADASLGNYNLNRFRGELNVPLGEDFALRASVQEYQHDGFAVDTDPRLRGFREDDANDVSGRLALLWKPTDYFTATVSGEWYQADTNGAEQKNINDPNSNPRKFDQDFPGLFDLDTELYHLNLDWETPWAEIKSVSGFQQLYHRTMEDSSRSSYAILGSYDDDPVFNDVARSYTEELDLLSRPGSPIEWIIGGFGINEEAQAKTIEFETSGSTDPGPYADPAELDVPTSLENGIGPYPNNLSYGNISTLTKQGWATFARLTYHLLPNLRISAGARYNWDRSANGSFNFSKYGASSGDHAPYSASTPTWRFEADYDLTPENMIYASVARGYKPGGLNGNSGQAVVQNSFAAETNTGYEIGSKNYFFDHTLQFNATAFYYDHNNFQYIEQDPVPFDDGMANIPHIRDYGGEFELHYHGMENKLHIDASLTLEKGEVVGKYLTIDSTTANAIEGPSYSGGFAGALTPLGPCIDGAAFGYQYAATPYTFAGGGNSGACYAQVEAAAKNIQGKSPPAMPNESGSISVSYDFDLLGGELTPYVQYVYRGHEWARIFNEPSLDSVDPYGVTNLNLQYVPPNTQFKLSIAATNVFNVAGINSQYTDPYGTAATSRQYIAPRQIIGTVAITF